MEKTKDWRNVVTKSTDSLSKGIKVLHDGALRIALVVGQDKKLLGTLTDGDVRRALIKNMPMDTVITSVMNAHPTTVSTNIQKKEIIALMESNDLLHMPVLNENSELCDLITLQQLHKNPIYENDIQCFDQIILKYRIYSKKELTRIIEKYWNRLIAKNEEYKESKYKVWSFGYTDNLASKLLGYVKEGKKTGTSSALEMYGIDEKFLKKVISR